MEKAILLTGKENEEEFYQLLIGLNYTPAIYDPKIESHITFLENAANEFANELVKAGREKKNPLELMVASGYKINDNGEFIQVSKINSSLFEKKLISKLKELRGEDSNVIFPAMNLN